jgi:hypothetical protein
MQRYPYFIFDILQFIIKNFSNIHRSTSYIVKNKNKLNSKITHSKPRNERRHPHTFSNIYLFTLAADANASVFIYKGHLSDINLMPHSVYSYC